MDKITPAVERLCGEVSTNANIQNIINSRVYARLDFLGLKRQRFYRDIAQLLDKSPRQARRVLGGDTKYNVRHLVVLGRYLGVDVCYLLGETDIPSFDNELPIALEGMHCPLRLMAT
jgi:hypothetical protein